MPIADDWHARFSCIGRRYLFRILNRRAPPALDRDQVWHIAQDLDIAAMQEAAAHLVGRHDFTTFCSAHCQSDSPVKTLDRLDVEQAGEELHVNAAARSFLHHQVRSMVGCLALVGRGQWSPDDMKAALEAKVAIRATRAHVVDVREEFAQEYILPALQAGAIYEGRYPLATALGRPLIAKKLVEVARIEGAFAIAHGCTGKGNDQVRLDVTSRALEPDIQVIAPAGEWGMTRPEEIEYARAGGTPVPASIDSPYSTDTNLWGRSIECGVLEDPWHEPPEEIYTLTKSPGDCPDMPAYVEIGFEAGVPVSINGLFPATMSNCRRQPLGRRFCRSAFPKNFPFSAGSILLDRLTCWWLPISRQTCKASPSIPREPKS